MAFRALPDPITDLAGVPAFLRAVKSVVNLILQGKLNATLDVTLTANQATTAVNDPRLSGSSGLYFMPQTANAAAEIGNGTLYVSARGSQSATLTHANNAQADRTYTMLIIG
jgi:hypothetical protein